MGAAKRKDLEWMLVSGTGRGDNFQISSGSQKLRGVWSSSSGWPFNGDSVHIVSASSSTLRGAGDGSCDHVGRPLEMQKFSDVRVRSAVDTLEENTTCDFIFRFVPLEAAN